MTPPGARRRGMSLLSFLIVLALLTFIMIPLFSSFQSSRLGAEKSVYYLLAATLLSSQLEKTKSMPYRELEEYVLGLRGLARGRGRIDPVNGPFEAEIEAPDVIEIGAENTGKVVFDRYTFISYFPHKNPNPSRPDFYLDRQRIRIRVDVVWKEPVHGRSPREQTMTVSTIVHNENFNPKPALYPGPGAAGPPR